MQANDTSAFTRLSLFTDWIDYYMDVDNWPSSVPEETDRSLRDIDTPFRDGAILPPVFDLPGEVSVPEPASVSLAVLGLIGAMFSRSRRGAI